MGGRPHGFCVCHQSFARMAAGATWALVIANAPWAGRYSHSTVIDAAGAIYVLGGYSSPSPSRDVWASTDGGADWTTSGVVGVTGWVLRGYYEGTTRVLRGYWRDPQWSTEVFEDCTKWISRVLEGYSRSSLGCTKGALCVRVGVCMCMCMCVFVCACLSLCARACVCVPSNLSFSISVRVCATVLC
jgi:hypothetical protein